MVGLIGWLVGVEFNAPLDTVKSSLAFTDFGTSFPILRPEPPLMAQGEGWEKKCRSQ